MKIITVDSGQQRTAIFIKFSRTSVLIIRAYAQTYASSLQKTAVIAVHCPLLHRLPSVAVISVFPLRCVV